MCGGPSCSASSCDGWTGDRRLRGDDKVRTVMSSRVDTVKGVAPSRGCGSGAPTGRSVWGLAPSRGVGAEPAQDTGARELAEGQ
ncbi:hypothetical protein Atai01_36140 [Amycolatopsis taiwanensis]|uniref:Uncharacterized protein n=1 Tax=Amycolatopsis taiwanensis TaxID=342230 RepID=A0A9W6VFP4_9PSEU|nr:hypothetical protein Atai01_36140 [Amycolatopsis taiwanensis]